MIFEGVRVGLLGGLGSPDLRFGGSGGFEGYRDPHCGDWYNGVVLGLGLVRMSGGKGFGAFAASGFRFRECWGVRFKVDKSSSPTHPLPAGSGLEDFFSTFGRHGIFLPELFNCLHEFCTTPRRSFDRGAKHMVQDYVSTM